jgi:hypothetical protein
VQRWGAFFIFIFYFILSTYRFLFLLRAVRSREAFGRLDDRAVDVGWLDSLV